MDKEIEQMPLFDDIDEYDVNHREWKDMPEYNNVKPPEPLITVTIKFETEKDYDLFHKLLKKHIYNGNRIFDGAQRMNKKSAWFPSILGKQKYVYESE